MAEFSIDGPPPERAIHEHFKLDEQVRVEVDHNGWKGDGDVFLELQSGDPGSEDYEYVIAAMGPKKAVRLGMALLKAAALAKVHRREPA